MFPQAGLTLAVRKDNSTGNISIESISDPNLYWGRSWFKPTELIKQLRELADYVEKYGTDGKSDKGKLQGSSKGGA